MLSFLDNGHRYLMIWHLTRCRWFAPWLGSRNFGYSSSSRCCIRSTLCFFMEEIETKMGFHDLLVFNRAKFHVKPAEIMHNVTCFFQFFILYSHSRSFEFFRSFWLLMRFDLLALALFSKARIFSSQHVRFIKGSHVAVSAGHPFQRTRYWTVPSSRLCFPMIFSTSHSVAGSQAWVRSTGSVYTVL